MASVLITLDSLKNNHTGLYFFAKSLGLSLSTAQKSKSGGPDLTFYINKGSKYLFGKDANTISYSKLHQLFFPHGREFDIVHFTDQICRLPPHRVRAKRVLTIHDLNQLHESSSVSKKTKKKFERLSKIIDQCDKIIAISTFVQQDILDYFPNAKGKTQVIYNGCDKLIITENHVPLYVPEKPFLFSIGEILPKKNFHVLPKLLSGNDYQLILAGKHSDPAYVAKILEAASELGERVKLIGAISDEDKAWYYANCSAFVFPSIAEGFGLPVVEAMHFGKPVFLSNRTALPEIGADAAFYFQNFELKHMQEVFDSGMRNFEKDGTMQMKVFKRAECFTWDKAAQEYLKLYRQLS